MFNLVPESYQNSPIETLEVLTEVAEALTSILGHWDEEGFNKEAREGFWRMARALTDGMRDACSKWGDHLVEVKLITAQRDLARAEAQDWQVRFAALDAAVKHTGAERMDRVPDLTEPAVHDPGATLAG